MTGPEVDTAFPKASVSCTAGWTASGTPLTADGDGCVWTRSRAAAPGMPVALKVTGLPRSPATDAVTVLSPTADPSVQVVRVAIPAASVEIGVPGTILPPPPVTSKATATPATGLPPVSVTFTDGGASTGSPAVSIWLIAEFASMVVAALAVPVAWKETENPAELATSRLLPALVPRVHCVAARPSALVVADVGLVLPPPVATAKVTFTPGTPFASASRSRTTRDVRHRAPTTAVWLSPDTLTNAVGNADTADMMNPTGDPLSPALVAVAPCGPALPPSVRCVAAVPATPVVLVAGLTDPPPVGRQAITLPLTALPYWSVTRTTRESASAVPTTATWPSPS